MIDRDILLILIGAGISLVSSSLTIIVQHYFSLREELKKLEWEEQRQRKDDLRKSLLSTSETMVMPKQEDNKVLVPPGKFG
jgi:hypothetical protein